MSNIAPQHLPQKPLAWLSAHALSLQLAEGGVISSHREAMMKAQQRHHNTLAAANLLLDISRNSFWQIKVKPLRQQIMA